MKPNTATAWALQRPTGELVPAFIRSTRIEVLRSIAAHFGKCLGLSIPNIQRHKTSSTLTSKIQLKQALSDDRAKENAVSKQADSSVTVIESTTSHLLKL